MAGELLLESRPTDLSYTLCRYGVPNGPYLVFPLVGGVSARNLSGRSATQVAGIGLLGPLFAPLYPLPQMTGYAQSRQVLDFILDDALDPYARERAVVRQREALACGEDPTESLLYKQLGTNELQEAQRCAGSRQAVDQLPHQCKQPLWSQDAIRFDLRAFLARWCFAAFWFSSITPLGDRYSTVRKVCRLLDAADSVALMLVIFWSALRATLLALRWGGIALVTSVLASLIWVLADFGLLDLGHRLHAELAVLLLLSGIMTAGVSSMHVLTRLTGQTHVDSISPRR